MGLNPRAALKHGSIGPTPTLQGKQMAQVEPMLTRDQQVLASQAQSHKDMRDQCYSSPGGKQAADSTVTWKHRQFHPITGNVERWAPAGIKETCAFKRQGLKSTPQLKLGMTILQNELPSGRTTSYSKPNSPFRHMNSPELKYLSLPVTVFSL